MQLKGLMRPLSHTGNRAVQVWEEQSKGLGLLQAQCDMAGKQVGLAEQGTLLLGLGQAVLSVKVVNPHPLGTALGAARAGEWPGPALSMGSARPFCAPITRQQALALFFRADGQVQLFFLLLPGKTRVRFCWQQKPTLIRWGRRCWNHLISVSRVKGKMALQFRECITSKGCSLDHGSRWRSAVHKCTLPAG